MEHCWFLGRLQRAVEEPCFSRLFVTHIEMVVDTVRENDNTLGRFTEAMKALVGCVLLNQRVIGTMKSDFLKLWLQGE